MFHFGKKKEIPACSCSCGCCASEEHTNDCCPEAKDGICCIKVLGAGCKSCHKLYENAKQAVKAMDLETEVEYITDMQKIMEYGAMRMPVLIVNETVVSQGKVLNASEIEKLLTANER